MRRELFAVMFVMGCTGNDLCIRTSDCGPGQACSVTGLCELPASALDAAELVGDDAIVEEPDPPGPDAGPAEAPRPESSRDQP